MKDMGLALRYRKVLKSDVVPTIFSRSICGSETPASISSKKLKERTTTMKLAQKRAVAEIVSTAAEKAAPVTKQEEKKVDNISPLNHVTIRKGTSLPPLEKCRICCSPGMFHCPFCSPAMYKPTKRSKLMHHLEVHARRACHIGGYVVYRCGHGCRRKLHFHCLYCPATVMRRRDFIIHVPFCQVTQQRKMAFVFTPQEQGEASQTNGLTPREFVDPTYYIDSSDVSESDEISTVADSQDETSQERSSGCSVTHFVYRSSNCDVTAATGRTAQPNVLTCDQIVQTNFEKPRDCDEYYFMNLAKVFKRLTPKKKAQVRMKMERILFEAELE